MKKLISLFVLFAFTTQAVAVDQMRVNVTATGDTTKLVTEGSALALQQAQWARFDALTAKDHNDGKARNDAQLQNALMAGESTGWLFNYNTSANPNVTINGTDAKAVEVACDLLVKEAKMYKHTKAQRIAEGLNNAGGFSFIGGIFGGLGWFLANDWIRTNPTHASYYGVTEYGVQSLGKVGMTCAAVGATILLATAATQSNYAYWSKLEARFETARRLLNHKEIDFTQTKLNLKDPATAHAIEFIRTHETSDATLRQFVADVHTGNYDCLLLQPTTEQTAQEA